MNPNANTLVDPTTGLEIPLAMQRLELQGNIHPIGALLRVVHSFKCGGERPMEAIYVSMLPRDASLRRFIIKGEDFEVESELKPRQEARETYEEGIQQGHLSSIAEVSPDGLMSLSVGQVKPDEVVTVMLEIIAGVDLKDKDLRFRFPFTIAPSYHSRARTSRTPDGGHMELPEDVFGDLILPEWKESADGLHEVLFNLRVEPGIPIGTVTSPSHKIETTRNEDGSVLVSLEEGADVPNRDLVIDMHAEATGVTIFADEGLLEGEDSELPENAPRWSVMIPSTVFPQKEDQPRRICFVLDRSGSMGGVTMERAQQALLACLSALSPEDEFGIVRFDNVPETFQEALLKATKENRQSAVPFVRGATARGGTELLGALQHARKMMGEGGGDIFLLTDGQVFETGNIVERMASSGIRVHCLGIGAASQDRFLAMLARKTNGVERFAGVGEDVAAAAMKVFSSVKRPLASDLRVRVDGEEAVLTQSDKMVWAGQPVLVPDPATGKLPAKLELMSPHLEDNIFVSFDNTVTVPNGMVGLLQASRRIQDLEAMLDFAEAGSKKELLDQELKHLSGGFKLASRAMSLVAVVKREGDQPGELDQQVVPVGSPQDMMLSGVFGQSRGITISAAAAPAGGAAFYSAPAVYCSTSFSAGESLTKGGPTRHSLSSTSIRRRRRGLFKLSLDESLAPNGTAGDLGGDGNLYSPELSSTFLELPDSTPTPADPHFELMGLLTQLDNDGGIAGQNRQERILKTALLGLWALSEGSGMFSFHLERMATFLEGEATNETDEVMKKILEALVARFRKGVALPGAWLTQLSTVINLPDGSDYDEPQEAFVQAVEVVI